MDVNSVTIAHQNVLVTETIPVKLIKEFEILSDIKGYHAYMPT